MRLISLLSVLLSFTLVSGCQTSGSTGAGASPSQQPASQASAAAPTPTQPAQALPARDALAPLSFDAVVVDLPRGSKIGEYENRIYDCWRTDGNVTWEAGRFRGNDPEVKADVEKQLWEDGFNVPTGSSGLFQNVNPDREDPTHLLGARVTSVSMSLCHDYGFGRMPVGRFSGNARVTVEWQLYSVFEGRTVYQASKSGFFNLEEPLSSEGAVSSLLIGGVTQSAAALRSDPAFVALLRRGAAASTPAVEAEPVSIQSLPLYRSDITSNIDAIRAKVVVIRSGVSHGSGFFISPELIVTNHHVVGGSREVVVELRDGREDRALVLSRDSQRDVALLRLQSLRGEGLPIRQQELSLTEDVFAIGAPLDRSLSGTVTRGIVSNFLLNRFGLVDIQADVDIHGGNSGGALLDSRGNVVGISYSGVVGGPNKTSVGINFFIPILDGLKHLGVTIQ